MFGITVGQVLVFVLMAFFIGIAQTTGPIINMILMMGMDYPAKVSIALTYLFLAGGCLATIWKNASRRNPKTGKTFIKLDLIMLTQPIMSSGALFGGIFKNFFSQIMITVLFIVLFVFLIYDLCKVIKQPKQQQQAPAQLEQQILVNLQQQNQKGLSQNFIKSKPNIDVSKTYIDYEARSGSRNKLFKTVVLCVGIYLFTVLTALLRGSTRFKSIIGIDPCGWKGWAILFTHLIICIIICIMVVNRIIQDTKLLNQEQVRKYSVQVTHKNVWYFLIAGFFAGFFAALLAIGGSLILVPTWLKFGVDKNYAGNSVPTMIFMSSVIAFTVAYLNHVLEHVSLAGLIFYFVFSFVCSAICRDIFAYIGRKYQIEYLVIYLILFVVVCTLLALVPFQINRLLHDYRQIVDLGYLC